MRSVRIAERDIGQATVLGYGRTGRAVAEYLHEHGVKTFVSDSSCLSDTDRNSLMNLQIAFEHGGHTQRAIEGADVIVPSPGIDPTAAIMQLARVRGIPIISELDLAYLRSGDTRIIAVTGTNGKSTTVRLIEGILRGEGIDAIAAGNIGLPFITLADDPPDVVVLEVSSFQLEQSSLFHPQVACLLNISPDHLDRHGSMEEYVAVKMSIFARQGANDTAILPRGIDPSKSTIAARIARFDDVGLPENPFVESLPPHNRSNLRAAIACCRGILPDLKADDIDLPSLEGAFHLPYRMQEERACGSVRVINDSKSTNAASAITALRSIEGQCVLILGGRHKGVGYDDLAHFIVQRDLRSVILYGEGASFLQATLRDVGYTHITPCSDLECALRAAVSEAHDGDAILFSPACSSYDQYGNYVERGEHFSLLVRSTLGQESDS